VDEIMHAAIFDSTFPGGVVAVVKDGVIAYQKGFGYQTYKKLKPVKEDEVYDLASLTKVTATTPSVMKLIDEGKIHLDDKVSKYFPEFGKGKKRKITIRNLLLHNSGLPAFRVYIDSLKTEKEIVQAVKNEPLINDPGTKYVYSDLGFILLGKIVEQVTGLPLDVYARKEFYYPLGMHDTFYNPKKVGKWLTDRIPPAEIDTTYRMKTIQAEAHDERAYYMNGVSGHAGLFSSAGDLSIYCQMLLSKGSYAGKQYIKPSTIEIFTKRQSKLVNRGYGFDRKSKGFSTAGSLTSDQTFGHTGFTGTCYWIDPKRNLAVILLTNRAYPHRSYGHNINQIRAKVADAVVSSIID
jgi:CubicO group peptidase (beta-lactamase class C family)